MIRPLRLVPDDTAIRFMRGRFAGLITSAILSIASIVLFFYPGLNYGVDFSGGVVAELRLAKAEDHAALRSAFDQLHFGSVSVQEFGSARDVLVRLDRQAADETAQQAIKAMLAAKFPGTEIRRLEVVGARVSQELFRSGLLATSLALVAVLFYIWFRFDWQFGVGVVATLLLDATKTIGFLAVTRIEFDLNSVAAILMLVGYSVTDKVVVYDRIRENLRKYKTTPLRQLIDLSITQTLGRTVATSLTVLLSILPLAIIGGEAIRGFAVTIIFGIIVGTSSSIFIAAPILLFLGQRRLRPGITASTSPETRPATAA
jgi:preprotein translocase subunit SecF